MTAAQRCAVVLFNRDLRVHDHPALASAVREFERVVPLFVLDDRLLGSPFAAPNRLAFMLDALRDLDRSLRERGARLVVRRGDPVEQAIAVARDIGATAIFASADVSAYAQARERRLRQACDHERMELRPTPGVTVVPPGGVIPGDGDHFKVFTPYWRRWQVEPLRALCKPPAKIAMPRITAGELPQLDQLTIRSPSASIQAGGETQARKRLTKWLRDGLENYDELHDDLERSTSRLSADLRFGCLSPLELLRRVGGRPGADPFVRQLCWRDFYAQVVAARPDASTHDYRTRDDQWEVDAAALDAWKTGHTGYPIVDAGIRQLAAEGYMHNRARLIVGSFLTKDLYIDWREGARHFWDLLLDGDIPNNAMNWQWVAGTGNDSRPNRVLNPTTQAKRYDPRGNYVRRWVPELEPVAGGAVHEPWALPADERRGLDYPAPIVDHAAATARFKRARSSSQLRLGD